eukprot:scaffold24217_cov113-Cylindrotheca_fusiformis.AAC.1
MMWTDSDDSDDSSSFTLSEESSFTLSEDASFYIDPSLSTIWEETSQDLKSVSWRQHRQAGTSTTDVPPPPPPPPSNDEDNHGLPRTPKAANSVKRFSETSGASTPRSGVARDFNNSNSCIFFRDTSNDQRDGPQLPQQCEQAIFSMTLVRTGQSVEVDLVSDDEFTFESCSTDCDKLSIATCSVDTDSLGSTDDRLDENDCDDILEMNQQIKRELSMRPPENQEAAPDFPEHRLQDGPTNKQTDPFQQKIGHHSFLSKSVQNSSSGSEYRPQVPPQDKMQNQTNLGASEQEQKMKPALSQHCENGSQRQEGDLMTEGKSSSNQKEDTPQVGDTFISAYPTIQSEPTDTTQLGVTSTRTTTPSAASRRGVKRAELRDKIQQIEHRLGRIRSNLHLEESSSQIGRDSSSSGRANCNLTAPSLSPSPRKGRDDRLGLSQLRKQSSLKKLQTALDSAMHAIADKGLMRTVAGTKVYRQGFLEQACRIHSGHLFELIPKAVRTPDSTLDTCFRCWGKGQRPGRVGFRNAAAD